MLIHFQASLANQEKSAVVQSSDFTVPTVQPGTAASCSGGTIIKNGVDLALPTTTVNTGDVLRIKVTASTTYGDTKIPVLTVGRDVTYWPITTKYDPAVALIPSFVGVSPFDGETFADGSSYVPSSDVNHIEVLQISNNTISSTITVQNPGSLTSTSGKALVTLADYYNDKVVFVDKVTRAEINYLDLPAGARPTAVGYTIDASTGQLYDWVTGSGTNMVYKIDPYSLAIVASLAVGTRPCGISVDPVTNTVWVTNYGANTVSKINYSTGAVDFTYTVGQGPLECTVDPSTGDLWVVNSKESSVSVISATDGTVSTITVGQNPWDVVITDGFAYVSNSSDGTLTKITAATKTVVTSYSVCTIPGSLDVDASGNIWVASYGDSTLVKVTADAVAATVSVNHTPLSISVDDIGEIWVASMYGGKPPRTQIFDYIPDTFSFTFDPTPYDKNVVVQSDVHTVSGLGTGISVPCSVPNVGGFSIIKNGTNVGQTSTLTNGDTVQLQMTTHDDVGWGIQRDAVLFIGSVLPTFSTLISSTVLPLDVVVFDSVSDKALSTYYTSNAVTVSGLATSTLETDVYTTYGTIVKNGVDTGYPSAVVKNGDTVAVRALSSNAYQGVVTSVVTIGALKFEWSIENASLTASQFTSPFVIADTVDAVANTVADITFTVSGIADNGSALLQIPYSSEFPNEIYIHGAWRTGYTSWTVQNGDVVTVRNYTQNKTNLTTRHYIFIDQTVLNYNITTAPNNHPSMVTFSALTDALTTLEYSSNPVTISGMDDGSIAPITIDTGYVTKNGVVQQSLSFTVVNGDVLQWFITPSGVYGATTVHQMTLNGSTATWSIQTAVLSHVVLPGITQYKVARTPDIYRPQYKVVPLPAPPVVMTPVRFNLVTVNRTEYLEVRHTVEIYRAVEIQRGTSSGIGRAQHLTKSNAFEMSRNPSIVRYKDVEVARTQHLSKVTFYNGNVRLPSLDNNTSVQVACGVIGRGSEHRQELARQVWLDSPSTRNGSARLPEISKTTTRDLGRSTELTKKTTVEVARTAVNGGWRQTENLNLVTKIRAHVVLLMPAVSTTVKSVNLVQSVHSARPGSPSKIGTHQYIATTRPVVKISESQKFKTSRSVQEFYQQPNGIQGRPTREFSLNPWCDSPASKQYSPVFKAREPQRQASYAPSWAREVVQASKGYNVYWTTSRSATVVATAVTSVTRTSHQTSMSWTRVIGDPSIATTFGMRASPTQMLATKQFFRSPTNSIVVHVETQKVLSSVREVAKASWVKIHKPIVVPMTFSVSGSVVHGDLALGIGNTYRTLRFATAGLAVTDGATRWHFSNVQAVPWGDGTYVWTGDCVSHVPHAYAGYISGG